MKKALKFTLPLLPVALIAGYFVTGYQLEILDPALYEETLAQLGSAWVLTVIAMVQTLGYALFCGVFQCFQIHIRIRYLILLSRRSHSTFMLPILK